MARYKVKYATSNVRIARYNSKIHIKKYCKIQNPCNFTDFDVIFHEILIELWDINSEKKSRTTAWCKCRIARNKCNGEIKTKDCENYI